MIRTRSLAAAAFLILVSAGWAMPAESFVPYRQTRDDGAYVDWLEGTAGILGRNISFQDLSTNVFFRQAKQAAEDNGRARLLTFLRSMPIDAHRRLGDDPALFEKVRKLVSAVPPSHTESDRRSYVKVMIKVPLHGSDGIGSLLPSEGAAVPQAPEAPQAFQAREQKAPVPGPEAPTGLVIDATKIALASPSLRPRIVDAAGREIYGPGRADPAAALERGLAAFAVRVNVKDPEQEAAPRQGLHPLRVEAVGLAGDGRTEFVVSEADAERILKEDEASSFLAQGRVVILLPPPGGAAGPAPPPRQPPDKPTPKRREPDALPRQEPPRPWD